MSGLGADPLRSALIRLRSGNRVLGAGFLIAPDVVATCAHFVDGETPVPEHDDEADVAILPPADPPPGALPGGFTGTSGRRA